MAIRLFVIPTLGAAHAHVLASAGDAGRRWLLTPVEEVAAPLAGVHNQAWQFATLAQELLRLGGVQLEIAPRLYALRVVGSLLETLAQEGRLPHLAPVARKRGMAREVSRWIRELETQGVSPATIAAYDFPNRVEQELARVYNAYAKHLRGNAQADPDGIVATAARFLERESVPGLAGLRVAVVGFDQFTPVQRRLLGGMAVQGSDLDLYLAGDPERGRDALALARLGVTYEQIQEALQPDEEIVLPEPAGLPPALRHLRERLFEQISPIPAAQVRAIAAPSREAEVRAALRAAHGLIVSGVAPREIALMAPEPGLYQRLVQAVASDYELPIRLNQPLLSNPAVATCVALLSLASARFPRREMLDALRAPYVRHGLSVEELDMLDRLTRERPVIASTEQWNLSLQPFYRTPETERNADDDLGPPPLWQSIAPERMEALREKMRALFRLLTPPEMAAATGYGEWIERVVLGLGAIDPRVTRSFSVAAAALGFDSAPRDRRALELFAEQVALLNRTGGSGRIPWERYRADLLDLLSEVEVALPCPVNAIYFGPLTEGRRRVAGHLFVLGLNEGAFPRVPAPDLFYAPVERVNHPLLRQVAPGDDASLWWQSVSNVTGSLTLLRPRLDEKGNGTLASPYWTAVLEQFDGLVPESPRLDAVAEWNDAIGFGEQVVAVAAGSAPVALPAGVRRMIGIAERAEAIRARRESMAPAGEYEGMIRAPAVVAELQRRYGPQRDWSVSQLHRYAECPYGFFALHALALRPVEEPEERLDARTSGQIYHAILEALYGWMRDEACLPAPAHQEAILAQLDARCDESFRVAPMRYQFRPGALWPQEQREMRRHLRALLIWECEQDGGRIPFEQERRFGSITRTQQIVLELEADGLPFRLQGVIDRIDREDGGERVHIVDYKSGNSKYDDSKIRAGRALQTALYALALEKMGMRVGSSRYLHIRKREESGALEFDAGVAAHETVQAALAQVANILQSIRGGRFPARPAEANKARRACRERCELASICRVTRYSISKSVEGE